MISVMLLELSSNWSTQTQSNISKSNYKKGFENIESYANTLLCLCFQNYRKFSQCLGVHLHKQEKSPITLGNF